MAKREHQENVTGGLTDGLDFETPTTQQEGAGRPKAQNVNQTAASPLMDGYQLVHQRKYETRSAKLNILVKPSTAQKLDESVKEGKIKSRNDLINFLLEKYFEEEEQQQAKLMKAVGVDPEQRG